MIAENKQAPIEPLTFRQAEERDVDFLLSVYRRITGKTASSALDIACGTGDYARSLAKRKLAVIGFDDEAAMLDLARLIPENDSLNLQLRLGDLRHFSVESTVDIAICLRSRLSHLLSNEDLIRNMNAVANALSPGGLYIIELLHPRDTLLNDLRPQTSHLEYRDIVINRTWPLGDVRFDVVNGIIYADEEIIVESNGRSTRQRFSVSRRIITPQDLKLLAIQSGTMRVIDYFGAFDTSQPLDNSRNSNRIIAVLQKTDIPLSYLSAKLEVRPSKDKGDGFGVFARENIKTGELLLAYGGKVLTRDQLKRLKHDPHRYSLQIEEEIYLTSKGTLADYVNHSCDPNAGVYGSTMFAAMRNIEPGEEICWDYAMSDGSPYDEFDCNCGTALCRLKVTGNDWRIPALWDRYAGYFSPYLQRRIDRLKMNESEGLDES